MADKTRVLLVNFRDIGGGASKIALSLHQAYLAHGIVSNFLVGEKKSELNSVYQIPQPWINQRISKLDKSLQDSKVRGAYRLHQIVELVKNQLLERTPQNGKENFCFPESRRLVKNFSSDIDVIHFHNLHNEYFDLRMLPLISEKKPVVITMHDEFLYTGHCAYSLDCKRWKNGCGACPYLDTYPAVDFDNTHFNWTRKKKIFSNSNLYLIAPSEWLAERTRNSLLNHLPIKVIRNGINLNVFKPNSKTIARENLGLPQDAFIIFYSAAAGRQSKFKNYEMLDRVFERFKQESFQSPVILIALGGWKNEESKFDSVRFIEKKIVTDPRLVAKHYNASDIYIHSARAENAPLSIMEAMACGKPIVATNVGGIPELVSEGITGNLVNIEDDDGMFLRIVNLMENPDECTRMGANALRIALKKFSKDRMVREYLNLYQEVIHEFNRR